MVKLFYLMNPWSSVITKMDNPDYLVIDLDPSEKNTFEQVIDAARALKEILDRLDIVGYCKTSGSTGLHIYLPCGRKYSYDTVRDFAHILADMVNAMLPDSTTTQRSLSKRKASHIYLDYLQNSRGQTLASVYSARPKPGATVSTPLEWKEVKKGLHPGMFTIKNIHKRLEKKGRSF